MPPKTRRDRNCGTGGGLKRPREDAAVVENVEGVDYECAILFVWFSHREGRRPGYHGQKPTEDQVGTSWRQPSTPVAVAGSVLALLFAVAAVAAAPTAALRAYLVEGVDAVAAVGEDDGNRDLAVVVEKDDGNSDQAVHAVAEDDGHYEIAVVVVKDNGHGKLALLPVLSPYSPSNFGPAMRPHSLL